MILAAHQPNFVPWLPYFDKMNKADVFIVLNHVQFEKNGWQNRCQVQGTYWTNPVRKGNIPIKDKTYTTGQSLYDVNIHWILAIAKTLNINTNKIHPDFKTDKTGTERIIELCKRWDCDQYLTNPDATGKYLDEKMMNDNAIELIPHTFPNNLHVFEAFDKLGIEGTQKLLAKEKACLKT